MPFVIKHRGAPTPFTIADYYCEDHGRFELEVERTADGDAPDTVPCPEIGDCHGCGGQPSAPGSPHCAVCDGKAWSACDKPAVWCISAPLTKVRAFEAVKGKSQKPEHETWTDTSAIGEGQPLYDWHEDRAAVWERKRQRDVVKFAREHNERVRGD